MTERKMETIRLADLGVIMRGLTIMGKPVINRMHLRHAPSPTRRETRREGGAFLMFE